MAAHELKLKSAFAGKAATGRGVGVEAAVAAAQARVDGMREAAMARMGELVGRMQAVRPAVVAGSDQTAELRSAADALVGLGGLFDLPELAEAALSLCVLFDAADPGRPNPQTVAVHIDAVQLFWSAASQGRSPLGEHVLAGLSRLAALPAKRA